MPTKRQPDFEKFLADHPVFPLQALARARGDRELEPARNQLKHHLRRGRVKAIARGLYAVVPPGINADRYQPDPFLAAAAARPEGVFAYHSALELLGQAHSIWNQLTLHCATRRSPLRLRGATVLFLATPRAVARAGKERLGTTTIVRSETRLLTTGPERTLVEGFRQPHRSGGLEEHLESVTGFAILDYDLLVEILEMYQERAVWAAVGWLVERERERWLPPEEFLSLCRSHRPEKGQYLLRDQRGGTKLRGWNLLVPTPLTKGFEGLAADT